MDNELITNQYFHVEENIPWNIYPRPQMKRDSFCNLNGEWDFEASPYEYPPQKYSMKITVPYPVESALSGVGKHFRRGNKLYYRRYFDAPIKLRWRRVLLHCGGIDQKAEIFINGHFVVSCCTAIEGPLEVDVTPFLLDENELIIKVVDDMDKNVPYGKQSENPKEIWYSPVSGIWQTVWLESVPEYYIKGLKITTTLDYADVEIAGVDEGRVLFEGKSYRFYDGKIRLTPMVKKHWSPEDPHLYYFSVQVGNDKVDSYFALRTLEIKDAYGLKRLCLNGEPYFFNGVLHQGYWMSSIIDVRQKDGDAYGFDLSLKYENKHWYFWGVYALGFVNRNYEKYNNGTIDLITYQPHFDRRHNVNLILTYTAGDMRQWEFSGRWNFGTGFPFTQVQGFYEFLSFQDGIYFDYTSANGEIGVVFAELNQGRLPVYHRFDIDAKARP